MGQKNRRPLPPSQTALRSDAAAGAASRKPAPPRFPAELPVFFLAATLFLVPLFPDEKLNRLKLIVFGAGLILTALAWAARRLEEEEWDLHLTAMDPFLALYLLSAAGFTLASKNPAVAASEFERMIFSLGAFFAAAQVVSGAGSARRRAIALGGWAAGLLLVSLYGILQRSGGAGRLIVPQMERVFGTFGNPIFFAAFLIASIPMLVGWLAEARRAGARLMLLATLLLSLFALVYTGTRAAFLALPLALAFFYAAAEYIQGWRWTRALWRRRRLLAGALAALVLIHFLLLFLSDSYPARAARVGAFLHGSRITATQQTHTLIWKDVLRMWQAHPLFGTGYGTFHVEFPAYASEELKAVFPQRERIINDAHNEYLQILAETGIAGFAVFMLVIGSFFWRTALSLRAMKETLAAGGGIPPDSLRGLGLLGGVAALLIQNFFSVDMRFIVSSAYLFLAMGLAASFLPGFTRPFKIRWGTGLRSKLLKAIWAGGFLLLSGVVGFGREPAGLYLLGIYRLGPEGAAGWRWSESAAMGPGLLPALLRPYLAQKVLNRTPDFFDEKLLNAAQTIQDLENLTRQFPAQWKYWERLGYALAKEIQKQAPGGGKMNDPLTASRAVGAYRRAWELNPRAEGPPNNLGNIYFTLGNRREAIGWWQRAIEANPEGIDARLNLGLAYYYEGKIKESAAQFEAVLARDPKNEKAIVMLKRMVE